MSFNVPSSGYLIWKEELEGENAQCVNVFVPYQVQHEELCETLRAHSHRVIVSTKHLLNTIKLFVRNKTGKILITLSASQRLRVDFQSQNRIQVRVIVSMFNGCSCNEHAGLRHRVIPRHPTHTVCFQNLLQSLTALPLHVSVHLLCVREIYVQHRTKCTAQSLWDRNLLCCLRKKPFICVKMKSASMKAATHLSFLLNIRLVQIIKAPHVNYSIFQTHRTNRAGF